MSVERLAPEPSSQILRRISVDAQITKVRGEMALLCNAMRGSPEAICAGLARIRQHIEIAERHAAALER